MLIKKCFNSLVIEKIDKLNIGISYVSSLKSEKYFIDMLSKKIMEYKKIYKICFSIQVEDIIIRTFKNINCMMKKDLNGYVNYQICDNLPINKSEYILKYRILSKSKNNMDIQVILFPKSIKEICESIVTETKIKRKSLNINFDIIQKLIDYKVINTIEHNFCIIENLQNQIILHSVNNFKVENSDIFEKETNEEEIRNFMRENKNIFLYGLNDLFIEKLRKSEIKFENLNICKKIKIDDSIKNQDDIIRRYIVNIGMVI